MTTTFTAADLERAWQPIETAPKNRVILVWGRYWSDEQGWMPEPRMAQWDSLAFGGSWVVDYRYPFSVRPTHWMPLPAPPADLVQRVKE